MNLWFTDEVSNYSKKCVKEGHTEIKFETREAVVGEVNEKILNFIERWKKKQDLSMSLNGNNNIHLFLFNLSPSQASVICIYMCKWKYNSSNSFNPINWMKLQL